MKHYQEIINIPDLPDFHTFTVKVDFDQKESSFDRLRNRLRREAIDRLGVSDEDKERAVLDINPTGFERHKIVDRTVIEKIAYQLGLEKPQARVQVLYPGQYTMLHLDDLEKSYISPVEKNGMILWSLLIKNCRDSEKIVG